MAIATQKNSELPGQNKNLNSRKSERMKTPMADKSRVSLSPFFRIN